MPSLANLPLSVVVRASDRANADADGWSHKFTGPTSGGCCEVRRDGPTTSRRACTRHPRPAGS